MKKEAAFSGLEAAIVLIAFVVVAAVFSYVMLGAGFFATQKSQEVTYSGIKQSTSNIVLDGQLYGDTTTITALTFWLAIPEGGQAQNLGTRDLKFLWTKQSGSVVTLGTYAVTIDTVTTNPTATTPLLQPGSKAKIVLTISAGQQPTAGNHFALEIKPRIGASSLISKSLVTGYKGGVII